MSIPLGEKKSKRRSDPGKSAIQFDLTRLEGGISQARQITCCEEKKAHQTELGLETWTN
jgi:hypothetical protein